jgi:hypothetical protein
MLKKKRQLARRPLMCPRLFNNTVDKFGSPKSPMGWGLKRLENLIQDPLENPTTFLLFDELRRIGHHIGLLMMICSTSTSLVSA